MTLKDLFTHWEESVQHALAAQLSRPDPQQDDLLQAAGLHVRSSLSAGYNTYLNCPTQICPRTRRC
jgi:hypothetical protein